MSLNIKVFNHESGLYVQLEHEFHKDFDDLAWRIFAEGDEDVADFFIDVHRYGNHICLESFHDAVVNSDADDEKMLVGMYLVLMDIGSIEPADVLQISSYLRGDEECWDDVILQACGRK